MAAAISDVVNEAAGGSLGSGSAAVEAVAGGSRLRSGLVAGNVYFRERWLRHAAFTWARPVIQAAGVHLFAHSYHYYSKAIVQWDQMSATAAAKSAHELFEGLASFLKARSGGCQSTIGLSLQTWHALELSSTQPKCP